MPEITQSHSISSTGEDAITQSLSVEPEATPSRDANLQTFLEYYDVERTVKLICDGDYKSIALQFPDELLHDSVPVYQELSSRLGPERKAYVLADTSYGSCCVDEVTASHVDAEVLVHYGHACLSQTSRLPVIYVFGKKNLDVGACVDKLAAYLTLHALDFEDTDMIELKSSVWYSHAMDEISGLLQKAADEHFKLSYSPLPTMTRPASASSRNENKLTAEENILSSPDCCPISDSKSRTAIVWIGEESTTLTKLLMTSSGTQTISYSPKSQTIQTQSHASNKLLMRRYALLQKARDADVFGILIGTLGVASYLNVTAYIRKLLKRAHKKAYTVSVGKINPAKLANFMEIECWVWVSCSEGMIDSKDYLRPIITPYELELALQAEPQWTGKYVLDFNELLKNVSLDDVEKQTDGPSETVEDGRPMFSLVSGTYRHAKRYGDQPSIPDKSSSDLSSTALTRTFQEKSLSRMSDSAASQFLHGRTFKGLDTRLGQDAPSVLEQGRRGIAKGYGDDHRASG